MTLLNIGKGIAVIVFLAAHLTNAAQLLVSKPGGLGAYTTVMAAIKAAKAKDSVVITDEGVYEEQVTIDSTKNGLVLCSSNPTSLRKPTIKWQDKANVGPISCADAKIEAKITFDQNGALQVKRVRGVIIDGIAIDGGGAYPFGAEGVWDAGESQPCKYAVQHGNAALTLWITGDAIIRNCDITNAFFGINVKDRNEGGINANPNPADIEKSRVVALSGFGKTGNHVFEHNRIHDNSYGMFFESTWDLGSVIRYNLFFENHHSTSAFADKVKKLTSEGSNLAGGAIMFKDHLFSPLAIYNNTFWHNYLIFAGVWRPGSQFTIFNNIYAEPYMFWSLETVFTGGGSTAIDGIFVNRMHNSVYACQQQAPSPQKMSVQARDTALNKQVEISYTVYQPRIMNNVGEVEATNITVPIPLSYDTVTGVLQNVKVQGNRLLQSGTGANARGFPASADIRWLETKFKSTDSKSADFLVPDWNDSLVNKYVKDKGWEAAGILDNDGSRADLGAIPFSGKIDNLVKITPNMPVLISPDKPTQAMVSFIIDVQKGTFKDPVIKYLKWIDEIPIDTNAFGDNRKVIPAASIIDVPIPSKKLKVGTNDSIVITIPAQSTKKMYAFFELVVEGTDDQGNKVQSAMGFLSYRQLDYMFKVIVMSPDYKDTLNEVTVGQPYGLRLVPMKIGSTTSAFSFKVDTVEIALRSNFTLLNPNGDTAKISGGIASNAGKVEEPVVFMHIPENGYEAVIARGEFTNSSQGIRMAIWGVSKDIKVNPGVAENIVFVSPGSKTNNIIDPGQKYDVKLQLTDKFGNKVKQATVVSLKSLKTDVGNVIGSGDTLSDANGVASFRVEVTNGDLNDTFPIVGTLKLNGKADTTFMIVGKARPRMFIFYSDTAKYDPTVEIPTTTCSGTRVKVTVRTIIKTQTGIDSIPDINSEFGIEFSSDILAAYADDASDQKITSAKLEKGTASFWIQATKGSIRDGKITVFNKDSIKIYDGSRAGINFSQCVTNISSADYHADNGYGRVDRLDLSYPKKLKVTEVPDSLMLYWPTSGENKKIVKRESMTLDSLDSSHVIVRLPDPFPEGITFTSQKQLGTSYWKNPLLTDIITFNFNINEKVGPLITSAELIERLVIGAPDTMNITFSEFVQAQQIRGDAFTILRGGIPLNVLRAEQVSSTTLKVVVKNNGEEVSPRGGDSIKILVASNGTSIVVDGENNSAHPANRPVVITIKEIAPAIDSAYYKDENADGSIDKVIIAFNKRVKIGNLSFMVDFRGVFTDTLRTDRATYYQNDTTKIALDLNKAIKSEITGFTDGTMNVVVFDSQFKGTQITKPAADRAAPVVKIADYYQGRLTEDRTQLPDTLKIQFSENLKDQDIKSGDPFEFLQTSKGALYYVSLIKFSLVNNLYMFRVVPLSKEMLTQNVQWASTGDSVRIHTDGTTGPFADIQDNYQLNQSNIRVKMVVHEIPVDLDIRMGPNPFVPGNGSYVKIMIKPEVLRQQDVNVQTTVTILDNLGSCVFTTVDSVKGDITLEIKWDGTNRNGRFVGTGTYAVFIKAIDLTKNNRKIVPALKKLAVDRKNR